jgi:hypothetical protein
MSSGSHVQREIDDLGKTGDAAAEGVPVSVESATAAPIDADVNEFGEKTGKVTSNVAPHVFVDNGKTGSALDNTVGGRGGSGDQNAGNITLVGPQYESRAGANGAPEKAWVRPGTGAATVTRSYHGSLTGANGPTLWMTARAVVRTDAHEILHVQSSRLLHDANIAPLEARIAQQHTEATALNSGATAAEAQTALQTFINWNATVSAFTTADIASNQPGGTVDTTDVASPTFLREYGPRRVNGVNYQHYVDTPPGPAAGPTAPP